MSVSKYRIVKPINNQQIDIPIEIKWDFTGRDESIDEGQTQEPDEEGISAEDSGRGRISWKDGSEEGSEREDQGDTPSITRIDDDLFEIIYSGFLRNPEFLTLRH